MKRFVAFHGSANSGIQTKEKAIEWATNLISHGKVDKVHIAEVSETVQRTQPAVTSVPFFVELEGKAA